MKKRESRKVNFQEAVVLLIIIVAIMIWTTLIGKIPTAVGLVYCAALCGIYGKLLGHTWDALFQNVIHVVHGALPAIFLLLFVGFISASWIGSGTIPYMIYLGLELMHPSIYLFSAFLLCAIASLVTGSSWAIVSSLGIALIGIASGLNIPLPIAAGAIVSGCFLGDKWSPLSDTPNLAAAANRRDIIQIFTSMIPTSGLGAGLAAVAFFILGFFLPHSGSVDTGEIEALQSGLQSSFSFHILLLLPVILVFILAAKKMAIMPVLACGVAVASAEALLFQNMSLTDLSSALWNGYVAHTGNDILDALLSRGGVMSVAELLMLLFAALAFAGIVEKIGVLDAVMSKLLSVIHNRPALVISTILTTVLTVFLSSSVYVSIILNGKMYEKAYQKLGLDNTILARTTLEASAYLGGMVPWSGGAMLVISSLNVSAWSYVPWVFSFYASVFMAIVWSFTGHFSTVSLSDTCSEKQVLAQDRIISEDYT